MKAFPFLLLLLLSCSLFAQTTTTEIQRTSDTTFIQITRTVYDDGRTVTETVPYDIEGFSNLIVEQNITALAQIEARERANVAANRDVVQLRRYVSDSLLVNYDSLMAEKTLVALAGDWRLTQRNGETTTTGVNIAKHPTQSILLRMTNNDGPGGWNIRPIHPQHFEVRGVGQAAEVVDMYLTQFQNFTGYRGVSPSGVVLILRR
jgi:hypothetical protein